MGIQKSRSYIRRPELFDLRRDFSDDVLHLTENGARQHGVLHSRVCGLNGEIKVINN
jgi:hypothetical protein